MQKGFFDQTTFYLNDAQVTKVTKSIKNSTRQGTGVVTNRVQKSYLGESRFIALFNHANEVHRSRSNKLCSERRHH